MNINNETLKELGFNPDGSGGWELQIDPPGETNGAAFYYADGNLRLGACDGGDGGTVVESITSMEAFERLRAAIEFANTQTMEGTT